MRSHFTLGRGVAMACAVSGATALLNGNCSAQPFTAADYATNSAYADGWQEGDNGGFGFDTNGWRMIPGTYNSAIQHTLDSTSPHNQLGLAWTLFLPNGKPAGSGGADCAINVDSSNPPEDGGDLSRAGRGFSPLQVGQTISTVIGNPTEHLFYKGYTIRLVSGGQNVGYCCPGAVTRLAVGTFEYFTCGRWYTSGGGTSLFDTNTAAGMRLDVTLTGPNNYQLTMTPLNNPGIAYTNAGTLEGSGPINWIQYEHYNTDSDFYPTVTTDPGGPQATDFYIRSITITDVQPVPPAFLSQPVSKVLYAGQTARFSASSLGTPLIYQWRKDGTNLVNAGNISGALAGNLIINNVGAGDLGAYTLVVTNPALATAVTSAPPATLSVVQPTGTPYESAILATDPIAYWRLNETGNPSTNTPAYDYAGGLAGTYESAAGNEFNSIAGPRPANFPGFESNNGALKSSVGTNSWVTVPALNLNTNAATFTMWIYPNGAQSDYAGLFWTRDGTAAGVGYGGDFSSNAGELSYSWNNGSTYTFVSGLVIPANQWSFVAVVIDGPNTNAALYLYNTNGLASANNAIPHTSEAWGGAARIGNDPNNATFDGMIDEVAVFKYAMTPAQILNLYNTGVRVTLGIQRVGSDVQLSWPQGTLLEANEVTGPWTTNNAASPYTLTPTQTRKFYRVQVP